MLNQAHFLENNVEGNREELAHAYYIIAYTVIIYLYFPDGLNIATHYINKAINLTKDEKRKQDYIEFKNSDSFIMY